MPKGSKNNLADILVGSEGTLAYSTAIELKLSPLVSEKVLGACHFPTFFRAMDPAQHLVTLKLQGVELIDLTMVALGRDIPLFRDSVSMFVMGQPEAPLVVEFSEESRSKTWQSSKYW